MTTTESRHELATPRDEQRHVDVTLRVRSKDAAPSAMVWEAVVVDQEGHDHHAASFTAPEVLVELAMHLQRNRVRL